MAITPAGTHFRRSMAAALSAATLLRFQNEPTTDTTLGVSPDLGPLLAARASWRTGRRFSTFFEKAPVSRV